MVPALLPRQILGLSCTGMSRDSLGRPGMVPPILPSLSFTRMSGDSLGHPRMVPPLLPSQIVSKSYLGIAFHGH